MAFEILSYILLILGLLFCIVGIFGVYKIKDIYGKNHSSSLIDSAGVIFICFSLALQPAPEIINLKPILLGIFLVALSAPLCYTFMQIVISKYPIVKK